MDEKKATPCPLYRNTTVGTALQDTLDEMLQEERITRSLAVKVLLEFDKSINSALSKEAKARIYMEAKKVSSYRFCDNIWTIIMEEVKLEDEDSCDGIKFVDKIKIVACEGAAKK